MLKIYKNKGVSLIELIVAVGLGLTLIISMLAFYSISSRNVIDFQNANHDQQQIRKMMNLLETDIENTGGFECAKPDQIYALTDTNKFRVPTNIISLGDNLARKQIVFVHPVIAEYQHTALGMLDFNKSDPPTLQSYTPVLIKDAGCGQDQSPVYIGATVLEMLPMNAVIATDTTYGARADNIMAFVALSAAQSRRAKDSNSTEVLYTPTVNDATVMFLSDENNTNTISVGRNNVDIFLGFAPEKAGSTINTHVPDGDMTDIKDGGWINPFPSDDNGNYTDYSNYNLIVDKSPASNNTPQPNLLSQNIHSDSDGRAINTYPLKKELIEQVRAIKFVFTFGAHGDVPERTLTRIIRFKNTHLMKLD